MPQRPSSLLPPKVAETRAGFLFLHRVRQERHAHASLSLDGHCSAHAQLGSLPALLAALLPGEESSAPVAGSAPLRYLRLGGFRRLSPPEVQGCAGLGAVQHLSLGGCGGGSDAAALEGVQAALAALLHQMPALQELDLARWPGSSLPGWLVASMPPGLTKLELGESGLASLPHGAALAGGRAWLHPAGPSPCSHDMGLRPLLVAPLPRPAAFPPLSPKCSAC